MNKTMTLKKIMPLILSLCVIFLILGAVSASENNMTDDVGDEVSVLENSVGSDDFGAVSQKTFKDLNDTINKATVSEDGYYHVDLDDNYTFNEGTDGNLYEGIGINHGNLIINGN